jgi:hypothetical protein
MGRWTIWENGRTLDAFPLFCFRFTELVISNFVKFRGYMIIIARVAYFLAAMVSYKAFYEVGYNRHPEIA